MNKEIKDAIRLLEKNGYIIQPPNNSEIIPSDFLQWWKVYNKQINRSKCLKLWLKLTEKEKQDCITNTPAYVESTNDKQFRKNPETFLRNKSFYDEVIIRDNKQQQRQQRLNESAALVAKYGKKD